MIDDAEPAPGMHPPPPSFWARVRALGEILLAILSYFAASILIMLVGAPFVPAEYLAPLIVLGMWCAVLVGRLFLARTGASYRALGFRRPDNWLRASAWAGAAFLAIQLGAQGLVALLELFIDARPPDVAYVADSVRGNLLAYILWMTLVVWGSAAFGEELFARGFLLDRFQILFARRGLGLALAVFTQAAMFGALHYVQGLTGILLTSYIGIVLGVVYIASGRNLWAAILAHGAVNSLSLTLLYLGIDPSAAG